MERRLSRRTTLLAGFGLLTAVSGAVVVATAKRPGLPERIDLAGVPGSAGERAQSFASEPPQVPTGFVVPIADIPVGGGKVYVGPQVVVTQPEAGQFSVLHSQCPHDNCDVGDVRDGKIICFCHGSLFTLTGGVKKGPARKGLAKRDFVRQGDVIVVTDVEPQTKRGCGNCRGCQGRYSWFADHSRSSNAKLSSVLHWPSRISLSISRASSRMPSFSQTRTEPMLSSSTRAYIRCAPNSSKPIRMASRTASVAKPWPP